MPLVVRVERAAPPHHTDVLEAAAKACLVVWHDERAAGEWAPAFAAWIDGRFRKVVRRARGAPWEAAGEVPGVLVRSGTAEVRAYPPVPNAELPRELAKLQVGGTDLVDPAPPGPPPPDAARLWLHPTLEMTTGKAAAQAGHGSMLLWSALPDDAARERWRAAGYPLAVRRATVERWEALAATAPVEVADGGFTEVAPGSVTVRAEAPPA
jgi:peptidyl-tRNA hydrolase